MYPTIFFIDSYSLMIVLGVACAILFVELYFKKTKEYPVTAITSIEINAIISVLMGLVGAYAFQALYNLIARNKSAGGLTFYGGLIFGAGTFIAIHFIFIEKKYKGLFKQILIIAPSSITIAHGIGRIGCFLAGCCYGKESSKFGLYFPSVGKTVIPTNLYEAIFLISISIILLLLALKKRFRFNFPIYMISYSIFRFLIEYLRDDYRGSFIPGLSPSQFWSIILFIGGIAYLIFLLRKKHQLDDKISY